MASDSAAAVAAAAAASALDGGSRWGGLRMRRKISQWLFLTTMMSASSFATAVVAWSSPQSQLQPQRRSRGRYIVHAPPAPGISAAFVSVGSKTTARLRHSPSDDDDDSDEVMLGASDPAVLDAMFRVGEIMSQPPSGGVTRASFRALPVIAILSGPNEQDLSLEEFRECWEEGASPGGTEDRVDRAGFERVWEEVRECFDGDIIEEARKTSHGAATAAGQPKGEAPSLSGAAVPGRPPSPPSIGVLLDTLLLTAPGIEMGTQMSPDAIATRVKSMKDEDLMKMLVDMSDMSADEEARIRSVGDDPDMLKLTYDMMKTNGFARKAGMMAMKASSPDLMRQALDEKEQWYRKKKLNGIF